MTKKRKRDSLGKSTAKHIARTTVRRVITDHVGGSNNFFASTLKFLAGQAINAVDRKTRA